jgi:hypothetical protein
MSSDGKRGVVHLIVSAQSRRTIDFDQTFSASDGEAVFDDRKNAGLSIRVPATMAVDSKKGGHIINSEELTDGKAWSQPVKWCDYYGPVEDGLAGLCEREQRSKVTEPER